MKKGIFFLVVIAGLAVLSGACQPTLTLPVMLTPTATPSPIPTVNLTPVCGAIPATISGGMYGLANSGVHVLHNPTEWNNFSSNGYLTLTFAGTPTPSPGVPTPPVDFNTQMVVVAAVPEPCDNTTLTITDVCVGPTEVTVDVTASTCITCPMCNMASMYCMVTSAVAAPQSSLPVSVIYTYISH